MMNKSNSIGPMEVFTFEPIELQTSNKRVLNSSGRQLQILFCRNNSRKFQFLKRQTTLIKLTCNLNDSKHRAAPSIASIWDNRSAMLAAAPIA